MDELDDIVNGKFKSKNAKVKIQNAKVKSNLRYLWFKNSKVKISK